MVDVNYSYLAAQVLASDPEKLVAAMEAVARTMDNINAISPVSPSGVSDAGGRDPETAGGGCAADASCFSMERFEDFANRLARLFKKNPMDFGTFRLYRFRSDDRVTLIGVSPAGGPSGKTTRDVYEIDGSTDAGRCCFVATRNGRELFSLQGASFGRMEKLAVRALRLYMGQNRHSNACRKRAMKSKKAGS